MAKTLFQRTPVNLDFCNMAPRTLLRWIRSAPAFPASDPVDVLVLIAHTKEFVDDRGLNRFLGLVRANDDLRVTTFRGLAGLVPALLAPEERSEACT